MKREFLQSLQVEGQSLSKEVIDAIMAENGRDIQAAKAQSTEWEEKYNQAVARHEKQLREMSLQNLFRSAVAKAGGRSEKAIAAMLDMETLLASEDLEKELEQALEGLKAESAWLFQTQTPPPYAGGTGTGGVQEYAPATLAGALRERFAR